jgi:hypothetical protein
VALSGCGQLPVAPRFESRSSAGTAAPVTSSTVPTPALPGLLAPGPTCPLDAAAVSSIVGAVVHEEGRPDGSCAFDTTAGGQGLQPSEIRVSIQKTPDDLSSVYRYFAQKTADESASCRPFRLLRRPDLGPGAFETACGATATLGPSSADDFIPADDGAVTVTVNRGLSVRDHSISLCQAELATLVALIRRSW